MVARRAANDSLGKFRVVERCELVVCAPQLERKHRLQVLALQPDLVVQSLRQIAGPLEGRLDGYVINRRIPDLLHVVRFACHSTDCGEERVFRPLSAHNLAHG